MFEISVHANHTDEDEQDLTPPLLEEAVNLLLVNKTVMSCILVLQNRRDTEKNQESTRTELPTVIHVPSKVSFWIVTKKRNLYMNIHNGKIDVRDAVESLSFRTHLVSPRKTRTSPFRHLYVVPEKQELE